MRGEWCYFHKQFTAEECDRILEIAKTLPVKDGEVGVGTVVTVHEETRRSKVRFIQKKDARFDWLFDRLWKLGMTANDEWFNFHLSKMDFIQFGEYDASYKGHYKKHHDVFWMNGDTKYHRKMSAVIQLTDPESYEGGDFEIFAKELPKKNEIRARGTVRFFPSFIEHQANLVTSGTRQSLACWFEGPKWR